MTRRDRLVAGCLAGAAAMAPPALRAAELPLWELGIGAGLLSLPHYRGSDQTHTWLLPVPYAVYRGEIFRADRDGARARLLESERLKLDLSVAASPPTRSRDNRAREGMPDLAPTVELGPNLNLTLHRAAGWKLDFRLPVRAVATVERQVQGLGWTASPVLNLDIDRAGWNLGLQAGATWSSRRLNAYFYDVADDQVLPDRPAYRAAQGYAGWQATVALSRRFANHWTGLFVRWDSVGGAVFDDSPLVRRRDAVWLGVAWSWIGWQSEQRVMVPDERP